MKSKLDKAIEMTEHELQKMPNEQRKHIEVLLQAAKLLPTFVEDLRSRDVGERWAQLMDLTRERTPEEVSND